MPAMQDHRRIDSGGGEVAPRRLACLWFDAAWRFHVMCDLAELIREYCSILDQERRSTSGSRSCAENPRFSRRPEPEELRVDLRDGRAEDALHAEPDPRGGPWPSEERRPLPFRPLHGSQGQVDTCPQVGARAAASTV